MVSSRAVSSKQRRSRCDGTSQPERPELEARSARHDWSAASLACRRSHTRNCPDLRRWVIGRFGLKASSAPGKSGGSTNELSVTDGRRFRDGDGDDTHACRIRSSTSIPGSGSTARRCGDRCAPASAFAKELWPARAQKARQTTTSARHQSAQCRPAIRNITDGALPND